MPNYDSLNLRRKIGMKTVTTKKRMARRKSGDGRQSVMSEILRLRDAIRAGHLSERADLSQSDKESMILLWRVNDMLDAITKPLYITAKHIEDLSKDIIPSVISDEFTGEFETIKNNLNAVIKMMTSARDVAEKHIDKDMAEVTDSRRFINIRKDLVRKFNRVAAIFIAIFSMGRSLK